MHYPKLNTTHLPQCKGMFKQYLTLTSIGCQSNHKKTHYFPLDLMSLSSERTHLSKTKLNSNFNIFFWKLTILWKKEVLQSPFLTHLTLDFCLQLTSSLCIKYLVPLKASSFLLFGLQYRYYFLLINRSPSSYSQFPLSESEYLKRPRHSIPKEERKIFLQLCFYFLPI